MVLSEDSPQENGVQTNPYSSISPADSPVAEDDDFSTYFEEKVPIPESGNQVLMTTGCNFSDYENPVNYLMSMIKCQN